MDKEFPKSFTEMIGKEYSFDGNIFSSKKIPKTKMTVLGLKWGYGYIIDTSNQLNEKYPIIHLKVKNESMKRARWTKGFPAKELAYSYENSNCVP